MHSFIRLYYALTPAFWLLDWTAGVNLRTAALEGHPYGKMVYYLFCAACGYAIWRRPEWTSDVGRAEATINIFLLVLAILAPYYRVLDELAGGAATVDATPFAPARIAGLVLAGLVWAISFRVHAARRRERAR